MITDVSEENPALLSRRAENMFLFLSAPLTDTERSSETFLPDRVTQNPPTKKKRELQGHEVCRNIVTVIVKNKTLFLAWEKFSKTFNLNAAIYNPL
jgi:hypothetical protein